MTAWRVARSLDVLLGQLAAAFPHRSIASDGAIGDAEHASRDSDHDPWYGPGIVTARDFTHDPAHGLDIAELADQLVASRDRRIKYVIANDRIVSSTVAPWRWRGYTGVNEHRHHLHLSVVASPVCDDISPWSLPLLRGVTATAAPDPRAALRRGSTGARVGQLQQVLARWYPSLHLVADGDYGPATESAVRQFQSRAGLAVDGVAGPATLRALSLA